jgi:hypothetical protein
LLDNAGIQLCLADAFATYTMGPAYAYAAITLTMDPARPEDEIRVRAILSMLRNEMSGKKEGMSETYAMVADELRSAWEAAKRQAGGPFAPMPAEMDDELLVPLLTKVLRMRGYRSFSLDQWHPLLSWREAFKKRGWEDAPDLPDGGDLRHVLNAAWLARVDERRPLDKDITEPTMKLAERIRERAATKPAATVRPPGGTGP